MNIPNSKRTHSIIKNLSSIENGAFDETTIKELLIDVREYLLNYKLIREVADFIAHPDREKGIVNKNIDLIYSKWKYHFVNQTKQNIKVDKVPRKLFDTLFLYGVEQFSEATFNIKANISKEHLKYLIKKNYTLNQKWANLTNRIEIDLMIKGLNTMLRTVSFDPAFNQEQLLVQLKNGVKELLYLLDVSKDFDLIIDKYSNDIIVCIIALLHDTMFKLHDGSIARCFISSVLLNPSDNQENALLNLSAKFLITWDNGKSSSSNVYSIIDTNAKAADYIRNFNFSHINEIKEILTKRNNGKLSLIQQNT